MSHRFDAVDRGASRWRPGGIAPSLCDDGVLTPLRAGDDGSSTRLLEVLARIPGPAIAAAVGLAYLGLSTYVIWLNDPVNAGAGYWPAAGLTLAALVLLPVRRWPWVIAAIVTAEIAGGALHDYPLAASGWWAAGNALEPLVAALLLRRVGHGGRLTPLPDLVWFLVAGVLVGPLLGAAIGSVGTAVEYGDRWVDVFVKWWAGDGLGVLVVAPLLLCTLEPRSAPRSRREALLLTATVLVVPTLAFRGWDHEWDIALPYLVLPLVMWASVRFGVRGAAVVGFAVAEMANLTNALELGPFGIRGDDGQAKTILQVFLGSGLTAGLVIAVLVLDAVRRARTYDAQRGVAETLQAAVLPDDLPVVPGLSFAARYAPAVEDDVSHVGGDWYDAFTANGDVIVVVGDVSGHDLAAALVMGQVRNGLRTLFIEHDDPGRVLSVLDRQLALVDDGPIATAVCIRYRDGELAWTSAGHPPLLLLRSTGDASYLEGAAAPVLGVGVRDHEYAPHAARLERGDLLIAFTDGVIEHREWSLDDGLEHLRRLAATAPTRDPDALCQLLLAEGLGGRERTDDACVLVLARTD